MTDAEHHDLVADSVDGVDDAAVMQTVRTDEIKNRTTIFQTSLISS